MEIICIDKQTFEELRVRFCEFEERVGLWLARIL